MRFTASAWLLPSLLPSPQLPRARELWPAAAATGGDGAVGLRGRVRRLCGRADGGADRVADRPARCGSRADERGGDGGGGRPQAAAAAASSAPPGVGIG